MLPYAFFSYGIFYYLIVYFWIIWMPFCACLMGVFNSFFISYLTRTGLEGSDAALASILESLEFCLKLRGSEASVLEDLAKAINLVHTRQDLVESGHVLLNHAYRAQQEYERYNFSWPCFNRNLDYVILQTPKFQ